MCHIKTSDFKSKIWHKYTQNCVKPLKIIRKLKMEQNCQIWPKMGPTCAPTYQKKVWKIGCFFFFLALKSFFHFGSSPQPLQTICHFFSAAKWHVVFLRPYRPMGLFDPILTQFKDMAITWATGARPPIWMIFDAFCFKFNFLEFYDIYLAKICTK